MAASPAPASAVDTSQTSGVGAATARAAELGQRYVRFGPFYLDQQRQELFRDGSRIRMQAKVCEALSILVANRGEVVTRETLRARMWPSDTQINYDANVNTTVNKLRQALGDTPEQPVFVETIPRKGYTFIAAVELVDQMPAGGTPSSLGAGAGLGAGGYVDPSRQSLLPSARQIVAGTGAAGWFTAGVISLVIAAILLGAAITLFAHRSFGY
jgi:DNA-binding winged helix-turn-helix (wHTH) protein